jgi:predicted dehydrogenase
MSIRMGLIGAGRMGKVFAHTLAFTVAEADLIAVADSNPETSAEVAARYGIKHHYSDYHDLLQRDDIDAVVVMTSQGVTHDTVPYFMERFGEAYANEIRDFVACLLEDRQPSIGGLDARKSTAIGIAATRSLDEDRPVHLSEIE